MMILSPNLPLCRLWRSLISLLLLAGLAGCGGGGSTGNPGGGTPTPTPATAILTPSRTQYVRTDAVTEYFTFLNRHWSVFSPLTNRLFVADPTGNHVMVLDPNTRTRIATLDVPGAFGMDDTPDHTKIYVGTLMGDVYTIDPVAMTVTARFQSSQIGPTGFQASIALALSDGRVALLGSAQGISNVDGSSAFMVWNPVDNSGTVYQTAFTAGFGGPPSTIVCGPLENIAGFTRSADRTRVFIGSADSDSTLCSVDTSTGAFKFTTASIFPVKATASPDGKYIAVGNAIPGDAGLRLLDANTLGVVADFPVSGSVGSDSWFEFSPDSSTVYLSSQSIVYAYDVNTHQLIGWLPNLVVQNITGGFVTGPFTGPAFVNVGNGLLAGPMEQGVGFLDIAALHTGTVGSQFLNGYLDIPFGPVAGGSKVTLTTPVLLRGTINSAYFGAQRAPSVSTSGAFIPMTTPPGAAGPVTLELLMNDGGAWIIPEAFSYGPSIVQITPNASTAEGSGIGIIYGYGLGPLANTIPPDLTITVGGQRANIVEFIPQAFGAGSPPFLLQAATFTIPPGTAGTSVPVTVSNSSGSATANAAISYLPSVQTFSAGTTPLAQGIYDHLRDVYYFTDVAQVHVFSKTQGKFLPPISIPGSQRLWGISLSPDGSKLAISDAAAGAIYLLNPDTPATIHTFHIPTAPPAPGIISNPAGVAVSNAGNVYYTVANQGGTGFHAFFKLNTTTGVFTDYNFASGGAGPNEAFMRTIITADGTRVFFNGGGAVVQIDTATDKATFVPGSPPCCSVDQMDLALSGNNTRLSAATFNFDSNLNAESFTTLNDRESLGLTESFGMKLSPDGTLLFQPTNFGIDVYDARLGKLRSRIAMPFAFTGAYDSLVSDGNDNVLLAIGGPSANEIAVVDLSSLPEPAPLPYPTAGPALGTSFVTRNAGAVTSRFATNGPTPGFFKSINLPARPPFGNRAPHVTSSATSPGKRGQPE